MYKSHRNIIRSVLEDYSTEYRVKYSRFAPRLYNLCKSFGFDPKNTLTSRAFCSDENQGYPVIMLTKHFGAFPFNHGRVGGVVAENRHGPFAHHGKDLVIIQASHVGYDPTTESFGKYRRLQTECNEETSSCGKIEGVLSWYQDHYQKATDKILLYKNQGQFFLKIDENILENFREEGLFLYYQGMVECKGGFPKAINSPCNVDTVYKALPSFIEEIGAKEWPNSCEAVPIGNRLSPNHFYFRNVIAKEDSLAFNLKPFMPWIVTTPHPMLVAAQFNTYIEFDRTVNSILDSKHFTNKKVFFIASVHLDVSPTEEVLLPKTYSIPWAAFYQDGQGNHKIYNQKEIIEALRAQPLENPDQVNLDEAATQM